MNIRLLLPLAMMQGLWLLQRTPSLPAPRGRTGRMGNGSRGLLRVVGLGDSIMAGTGVLQQCDSLTGTFARLLHEHTRRAVKWRVHGINGATSAEIVQKLAPHVPAADIYVVSAGVNDARRGIETGTFETNLRQLFDLLRQKSPASTIFFGGLPPLECFPVLPWPLRSILAERARELQRVACSVTREYEQVLCFEFPQTMPIEKLASDGFHPAETACEQWARGLLDLWCATDTARTAVPRRRRGDARALPAIPCSAWSMLSS